MKLLYVLTRTFSLFGLPFFRILRNYVYQSQLKAPGINVDSRVRIQPLHSNENSYHLFGSELHVGSDVLIDLSGIIRLGDRVTFSEGSKLFTHTHQIDGIAQNWRKGEIRFSEIDIGDDAWIGANAVILSSVEYIGSGSVIAAGSVVRSDVPDNTIVAGVPACLIRSRDLIC